MQAFFSGVQQTELTMVLPFEDFLSTGMMQRHSRAGMCAPETLILDYVHDGLDPDDGDELAQAFAEACELASDGDVWMVQLDDEDVEFVRNRLCRDHGFRLAAGPVPDLVA